MRISIQTLKESQKIAIVVYYCIRHSQVKCERKLNTVNCMSA